MPMPWQLRNAKRRRPRHSEPRPTIELMPSININELRHVIPRYPGQVNEPDVSFKYPNLAYLRLSASCLEIMGRNGYVQRFRIVWIRTGLGKHRAILVCSSCGGGAIRLFGHYGNYASLLPPSAVFVAKTKDRQSQAPHCRKTTPQTWRLARHQRAIATQTQMETPQALSSPTQSTPKTRSTSQANTLP
jgi:hypothetical protein